VDYKLELVLLPVSDVDRSKSFYTKQLGFNLDVDTSPGPGIRVVQVTPSGSACSIGFGEGITDAAPGSLQGPHLVVSDIVAARDELTERGVDISEIRHIESGEWVSGPDPQRSDYSSFADFRDPDGNLWVLQEVRREQLDA
jgi:catechol 2,3-dioxygenase-like lactoylglutathione lyase family enzyme